MWCSEGVLMIAVPALLAYISRLVEIITRGVLKDVSLASRHLQDNLPQLAMSLALVAMFFALEAKFLASTLALALSFLTSTP